MATTGPLLQAAVICETVIEAADGTLSIVRIIDRITLQAAGMEAPADMPPIPQRITLVLILKSGSARGRTEVRVELEKPSGERAEFWTGSMLAESDDRGQNFVVRKDVIFDLEGLYWFHVSAEETPLTSVPFRLSYQRLR